MTNAFVSGGMAARILGGVVGNSEGVGRWKRCLWRMAALLFLGGFLSQAYAQANQAPTVSLTSPTNGAQFQAPASMTVTAVASGGAGTVSRVEFYSGDYLILSDASAPYTFTLNASSIGQYEIYARVVNSLGQTADSESVGFSVVSNLPPTVELISPEPGSEHIAPANLSLNAQASDSGGTITRVDFYSDEMLLGSDTTAPYAFDWSNVPAGSYQLTARATDNGGAVAVSAPVPVTVAVSPDSTDPTVSLTSPAPGASFTAPATVALVADANASTGRTITSVAFYNGGTLLGTSNTAPYSFSWTNVPTGTYGITARATDNTGTTTTSATLSVTVAPSQTVPQVSITSPAMDEQFLAPASLTVTAVASGGAGTVSRVEFYSGDYLILSDTSSPYTFTLNASSVGQYEIHARVVNSLGQTADSEPVRFSVVNNLPPSVQLISPESGSDHVAPANLSLIAQASDSDGSIASVDFYNGETLLASATTAPYAFDWTNVPAGSYEITARATDDAGAVGVSEPVSVTVSVSPDSTDPTVSLTSPAPGASFTAPATVDLVASANASAGRTITSVAFYNGATLLGTSNTAPYSFSWANVPAGTYGITARATDNTGAATTSATLSVNVAAVQNLPTVAITSPAMDAQYLGAPATVTVTAMATGGAGTVSRVEFYSGPNLILSDTSAPYTFTLTAQSLGNYAIYARVVNSLGQSADSEPVLFSVVNNLSPSVQLVSPDPAATYHAPASLTLTANASDSDGTIASVAFYNGSTLLGSVTQAPYTWTWNDVPAGTYSLSARATDDAGAVTSSEPMVITVALPEDSTDPRVSLTAPQQGASFVAPADIELSAQASAATDRTITSVAFFSGSQWLGTATQTPYNYQWQGAPAGNHEIIARATDNTGVTTTSASVNVVVAPSASEPSVSLTSPANNTQYLGAPATVSIAAIASGGAGTITSVEFYGSNGLITSRNSPPYAFTLTAQSLGNYSIYARVINSEGDSADSVPVQFSVVDNLAPTVQLVGPSAGSYHHAPASLTLQAQASDNDGGIASVSFYNGATLLGTADSAPYVFNWSSVPAGTYQLRATATDNNGALGQSAIVPVTVFVGEDTPRPSASLTAPQAGEPFTAPATINLAATAAATPGRTLTRVDFYNGSTLLGSDTQAPYTFTWYRVASGTYQVRAHAVDDIGAEGISAATAVVVAPDDRPPTVRLTSPTVAQMFMAPASVTLSAEASANQDRTITSLTFFNGQTPLATLSAPPFTYEWENLAAGNYELHARVTDSAGVEVSTPTRFVEVLGSDQAPTVSIFSPLAGERFASGGQVPISLQMSVGSTRTIRDVVIYSNGNQIARSTSGSSDHVWRDVPSGTHVLTATVVDDLGNMATSAPVEIVASDTETVVKLDLQIDRHSASAYIQDLQGLVDRVEFHRSHNGEQAVHLGQRHEGVPWRAFVYSSEFAIPGEHTFVAVAFDGAGNELARSSARTYTVTALTSMDLREPAVGLEVPGPASLEVSGRVFRMNGTQVGLSRVEVYVGAELVVPNAQTTSDNFSAQLTELPIGVHDIRVRAVAADGSMEEEHRRVRVVHPSDPHLLRISEPFAGEYVQVNNIYGEGYSVIVDGYTEQRQDLAQAWLEGRPNRLIGNTNSGLAYVNERLNWIDVLPSSIPQGQTNNVRVVATTNQGVQRASAWVNYHLYERRIRFQGGLISYAVKRPGNGTIDIDANDCPGCIAAVEVTNGQTVLQSQTEPPYRFNLSSLPVGSHTLVLRMIPVDASRGVLNSRPVSVTVTSNAPPAVHLTTPVNGATVPTNTGVQITAEAADADGIVSRVEFFNGEEFISWYDEPPYRRNWVPPGPGQYVLTARARDNAGAWTTSTPVTINVGTAPPDPEERETITYIHTDLSGSPLAATNANGNVVWKENYRAYGERRLGQPGSEGQRQWFHGKEADASTGLQYFGARYYDPAVGRFMGVDPVTFQEGNLHSFNRYAYGNNNPVAYLDPDGNLPILLLIPLAVKAVDFALTGVELYGAYQTGGMSALAMATADNAAWSVVPGGKTGKTLYKYGKNAKGRPDFVVNSRGTAVRADPAAARADLERAGFPGARTTETAEHGTIHRNVPGADGPMDVRIMDGQRNGEPFKGPRVRTTRAGADSDGVRSDGSRFRNSEPKSQRLEESHLHLPR